MAKKRVRPIPLVSGQSIQWKLDDFNWKKLEVAYGERLSPSARRSVLEATQAYLAFFSRERHAEPVQLSIDRVKDLKECAESFRQTLGVQNESNSHVFASHHIELQFSNPHLKAAELLPKLSCFVGSFISACEFALEILDEDSTVSFWADGTAWRHRIVDLTQIADKFDLPDGVRTDTDKNKNGQSPFVRFVGELQAQLPKGVQEEMLSVGALAKAINRARQTYRRDTKSAASNSKKSRQP